MLRSCPVSEHYKEAYPDAKVIGPEDLPKKKTLEFTLDGGEYLLSVQSS